jgi:hypothetical protein
MDATNLDHISAALMNLGLESDELAADERQALVVRLQQRLGVTVTDESPWDDHAAPQGILNPDGWNLIASFVGINDCYIFQSKAQRIWKLTDGASLLDILEDSPGFEFYVCDRRADYLLCHNHHDFVIGWGSAERWVRDIEDM